MHDSTKWCYINFEFAFLCRLDLSLRPAIAPAAAYCQYSYYSTVPVH